MSDDIPFDAEGDGDALRRLRATGSDLSKPMEIDFAVEIPNLDTGRAFAKSVEQLGFRAEIKEDANTKRWTCYCSRTMVPSYEAIVSIQRMLENVGRQYGARPDGWGSFGNAIDGNR
jgi:hypothetical protein